MAYASATTQIEALTSGVQTHTNTTTQTKALKAVHTVFKDATIEALRVELTKTRLDLERSRMAAEDTHRPNMKDAEEERRREETRRFWNNHHARLGTTDGQQYL